MMHKLHSKNKKQALLILTDVIDSKTLNLYYSLSCTIGTLADTILLYDKTEAHKSSVSLPDSVQIYEFSDSILYELEYCPIADTLIPGSNHFAVMKFFKDYPKYEKYWCVENDVVFTGNWNMFFECLVGIGEYDFITSHIQFFQDNSDWPWWDTLTHPYSTMKAQHRLSSFNPVYCLSNRAINSIDSYLQSGWSGHHEVLLPTLAYNSGYKLLDFGGNGAFTPKNLINKFYNEETFRWRPIHSSVGNLPNKLYHPVKPIII